MARAPLLPEAQPSPITLREAAAPARAWSEQPLAPPPSSLAAAPPSSKTSREFRRLIDAFHDGVTIFTAGGLAYANDALSELFGYADKVDFFDQRPRRILTRHTVQGDRRPVLALLLRVLRGHDSHLEDERTIVTVKGERVIVRFYYDAISFEGDPGVMITARDVSGDRAMQEKLSRAERMASVGTLAAGVAHEINNPLAYVTTNIAYCVERIRYIEALLEGQSVRIESPEALRAMLKPMAQALSEAHQGTTRVATIVRDLRALTREDSKLDAPVDLPSALRTAIHMSESEFRYRARLIEEFEGAGVVWGNETRLVQVFLNLIINAAQSFRSDDPDSNCITVRAFSEGTRTICEIEDNGTGITPENLDRIFHPFFTTKPVGVGTGLGLSICHGLVYSMEGTLSVQSESGRGSCFRVSLVKSEDQAPRSAHRLPSNNPVGRARVLVVDDEPLILRSVARLLQDQHDVEIATNGKEALAMMDNFGPFDLVVCDLMMPVMTGMDLHAEIARRDAEAASRFVFLTGGAFTEQARRFLASVDNPTLDKPVQPNLLRSVLSGVLGR